MSASLILQQTKWEQKAYWRNPAAAVFTFAFPLMFLVIFAAINGNDRVHIPGGEVKFAQYFVPGIVGFGLISASYTNLAFTLSTRRERGLLKRVRGTPLSPFDYLCGVIGNVLVVTAIITAATVLLGVVAYGVTFPSRYVGLVLTVLLGAFCFSALGVAMSTFVPNEDAAPAMINFVLFPLLFISGTFGQVENTSALGRVAAVFPVRPLIQQLVEVFNPFSSGSGLTLAHSAVMLAWGVGALALAIRRFRWEPRHR
jgi:ABC-2 type transport system permease protein